MQNNFLNKVFPLLLVLILVSGGGGCKKKNSNKWIYYDETYCSDVWTYTNNNEALKENIINHFKGKGVRIYEIEIFNDRNAEHFAQCNSKTGRRVKCKIKNRDMEEMKSSGFYE